MVADNEHLSKGNIVQAWSQLNLIYGAPILGPRSQSLRGYFRGSMLDSVSAGLTQPLPIVLACTSDIPAHFVSNHESLLFSLPPTSNSYSINYFVVHVTWAVLNLPQ